MGDWPIAKLLTTQNKTNQFIVDTTIPRTGFEPTIQDHTRLDRAATLIYNLILEMKYSWGQKATIILSTLLEHGYEENE
jgi:hypothetical protein